MKSFMSRRIVQALAPRARIARVVVALAFAGLFTWGCDVHSPLEAGSLSTIVVSPNPTTLAVNGTQQFTAVGKDFDGTITAFTPTWSVVAGGGAISATGVFTAGTTPGTFASTVKATSGSISNTATVIVTVGPLATIAVTPNPVSLAVGATQQFVAVGKDAAGNVVPLTPAWSAVAGGGSISSTGLFTAGTAVGTFTNTIQASSGTITGTATVSVTPGPLATIVVTPNPITLNVGAAQQFTAVGRDASGNLVAITPVWSVVIGGGSIDNITGLFTAGTVAGTFTNTVKATSGAISGTATVTVTPAAATLATITVSPNPVIVAPNATQLFTAVGRDASGNVVAITPVWSVANGGGTIGANTGVFTAGAVTGTFTNTVTATSGGISGTATVTVATPVGPLATITVSPNPASVPINGTQQFTAVGRDANGNVVAVAGPVWSVVNSGGTIDANTGVFTAGAVIGAFTNTVKATSGAISGTATVNVTPVVGPLASITVTPNPASVPANGTQQFTAVGRDAGGTVVAIAPAWSVVNGGGSITPVFGLFTAGAVAGTFTNTVKATSGAISGTATVTVTAVVPPPVDFLTPALKLNGIMAGTAFTCVTLGTINADIAISPGSTVTGFPPCVITGVRHLNDAVAIQDQVELTAAYNTLAGLPCSAANTVGTTNIGGTTKPAGVYCSASSIGVTGVLTLDGGGDPNAIFVFQAGSGLTTAGDVVLINSAQAKNVYWQVGSSATIGTASRFQGNILALTSISLIDNATLTGRALARNGAVSLTTSNTITLP